jgi:ribose transport system substrate-binding protein
MPNALSQYSRLVTHSPILEGIKEVVEAHGDRLITLDAQGNSLKQKNDISDLLLEGASGVFINPVNGEGINGSLLQAKEKRVAWVGVDAPVKDEDLVLCQVASDNVEAGRLKDVTVVTVDGSAVALAGTRTVFGLIALRGTQTQSVPGVLAAALLGLGAAAALC